jgi:hypothetical protein
MLANATPRMEALSASTDMGDIAESQLANDAMEVVWRRYDLSDFLQRAHKTALIRFNCFIRWYWDYSAGPITKQPRFTADMQQVEGQFTERPQGDIRIELVPPERVFIDPKAERVMPEITEASDARWLFYEVAVPIEQVLNNPKWQRAGVLPTAAGGKRIYGGKLPEDKMGSRDSVAANAAEDAIWGEQGIDPRTAATGASIYTKDGDKTIKGRMVRLVMYWEHPSETYPHGRHGVFMPESDWHVLEFAEELPEATAEKPTGLFGWAMLTDCPLPGRLAGISRMAECIDDQRAINKRNTQMQELRDRFLPVGVVDEDCGVTREAYVNLGALQVLKVNTSGGKQLPTVLFPPGVAQEVNVCIQEINHLTQRIQDKMEIHNPAYYPHKQGTTWSEISQVMFRDYSNIKSNDAARAERTVYAPLARGILNLMQRKMTVEQLVAFFGDRGKATVMRFKHGGIDFKDVHVVAGSSMELSRALKAEMALAALKVNLFDDQDPDKARQNRLDVLDMLGLELTSEMTIDQLQRKKQRDECLQMLQGIEPPIYWFDDHALHATEVVRFMLTSLETLTPEQRAATMDIANKHYTLHKALLKAEVGAAPASLLAAEANANGGAGQPPVVTGSIPIAGNKMLVPQPQPTEQPAQMKIPGEPGMGGEQV